MIRSMVKSICKISAVSLAIASLVTFSHAEEGVLNFGIISTESSQNLRNNWQPLLDDMSEELGVEVKPFFASDYAGVIQGMRFGKVDIAWYGNKSAMEAVDRASGEVFAQVVYDDGTTGYKSYLITHKDNDHINTVEDVLAQAGNLTFGNGDPNSTSGYLVPAYYVFGVNDVDANKIFKRTLNANHESNFMATANKHVDVATFNSNNWDQLVAKNSPLIEKVKVVWESPEISSDPLVWRTDLPEELRNNIKAFFITYGENNADEQAVLKNLSWSKFRESNNDQLIPTRELEKFKASRSQ